MGSVAGRARRVAGPDDGCRSVLVTARARTNVGGSCVVRCVAGRARFVTRNAASTRLHLRSRDRARSCDVARRALRASLFFSLMRAMTIRAHRRSFDALLRVGNVNALFISRVVTGIVGRTSLESPVRGVRTRVAFGAVDASRSRAAFSVRIMACRARDAGRSVMRERRRCRGVRVTSMTIDARDGPGRGLEHVAREAVRLRRVVSAMCVRGGARVAMARAAGR